MAKPIVIVGAGLAGLVCARRLHRAGLPFLLVDAADRVGGRLKTDHVGGFLLDHGYQVYLTAYPNASREIEHVSLDLMPFKKGAKVFHGGQLHTLEQPTFMDLLKTGFKPLRDKFLPLSDKAKIGKLNSELGHYNVRQLARMEPQTAESYLQEFGFSEDFMEKFARPFFGGTFLDRDLQIDVRQFAFVWKMMEMGDVVVPAEGMEEIPKQLAAELPKYLFRMNRRVSEVIKDTSGRATGVRLDTSETIDADMVVIATDAENAASITGLPTPEGYKSSITLYFETSTPCLDGGYIVLNGTGEGIVNEVVPISNVAPKYAPASKHLVSVTILGEHEESDLQLAATAQKELEAWFPDKGVYMWRFIKAYRIRYAQMAQPVGVFENLPGNETAVPGLYFAGEFTENSSIDGAIRSGMECASRILSAKKETEAA